MNPRASGTLALAGVAALALGVAAAAQTTGEKPVSGEHDALAGDLLELRLARLRLETADLADTLGEDDLLYVRSLLAEADSAYRAGDLDLAGVRLLEAQVYLEMFGGENAGGADENVDLEGEPLERESPFNLEAVVGADLWKEQFPASDQASQEPGPEGAGNPLVGLRADFARSGGAGTLQSYAEARYSRDYAYALLDADLAGSFGELGRPRAELRLSSTDYRQGVGVDYLQSRVRVQWELGADPSWTLAPVAGIWDTRYAPGGGSFFASFRESAYGLELSFSPAGWPWIDVEVRRLSRRYRADSEPDFAGFDLWTNVAYGIGPLTSTLWVGYETRRFSRTSSRWFSNASYRDALGDGRLRWLFRRPWGVELKASAERRDYLATDPATPDYLEVRVQVALIWQQGYIREVSAGPLFRWRSSRVFPEAGWSRWEDYRSWGIALNVELLQGETWSLHLSNTFENRVHPFGPPSSFRGLTLYDDRFMSSSLLLLSWRFRRGWELTATVNLDREDDRRQSEGDVQSTLLSLQLIREIL